MVKQSSKRGSAVARIAMPSVCAWFRLWLRGYGLWFGLDFGCVFEFGLRLSVEQHDYASSSASHSSSGTASSIEKPVPPGRR